MGTGAPIRVGLSLTRKHPELHSCHGHWIINSCSFVMDTGVSIAAGFTIIKYWIKKHLSKFFFQSFSSTNYRFVTSYSETQLGYHHYKVVLCWLHLTLLNGDPIHRWNPTLDINVPIEIFLPKCALPSTHTLLKTNWSHFFQVSVTGNDFM